MTKIYAALILFWAISAVFDIHHENYVLAIAEIGLSILNLFFVLQDIK